MAKAKRKPAVFSDLGTPERKQHSPLVLETVPADLVDTSNRDRVRAINVNDPLRRYRNNRTITPRQHRAGLALRAMWVRAGIEPRVTAEYMQTIGRGSVAMAHINGIDHYQRFVRTMRLFTPSVCSALISAVCLEERLPEHRVRYLKQGLVRLQREFGL